MLFKNQIHCNTNTQNCSYQWLQKCIQTFTLEKEEGQKLIKVEILIMQDSHFHNSVHNIVLFVNDPFIWKLGLGL